MNTFVRTIALLWLGCLILEPLSARSEGENRLTWHPERQTLDARLQAMPLIPALDRLANITGWHIFLEPVPGKTITTTFTNLNRGQAMRVLLGDMNYAFVPQTDGPTKLFVFRTSREAATTFLRGAKESTNSADAKRIRNELIIKVKPGTDIEALARKIGAKITGRLNQIGVYRLEFPDEAAAEAARKTLSENPEVEGIDVNYVIDPPAAPQTAPYQASGTPDLKLNPPNCDGKVVVGLIDTAIQPLGNGLDAFLLKSISVAGEANPTSASPTHATSMAVNILQGIQASGKNTAVQILPVNVYGANPTASTFDVAAGILAAVNNGANVINLSLGTPSDSAFLRSLIEAVTAKNIPVFAAAGNQPVATPTYPAAYSDVIAVTAGDKGQLASYANYGNFVDIIAPGTSFVNFNGQTWVVSGTSSASAFAAGRTAGLADSGCNSTFSAAQQVRSSMTFQSPVK